MQMVWIFLDLYFHSNVITSVDNIYSSLMFLVLRKTVCRKIDTGSAGSHSCKAQRRRRNARKAHISVGIQKQQNEDKHCDTVVARGLYQSSGATSCWLAFWSVLRERPGSFCWVPHSLPFDLNLYGMRIMCGSQSFSFNIIVTQWCSSAYSNPNVAMIWCSFKWTSWHKSHPIYKSHLWLILFFLRPWKRWVFSVHWNSKKSVKQPTLSYPIETSYQKLWASRLCSIGDILFDFCMLKMPKKCLFFDCVISVFVLLFIHSANFVCACTTVHLFLTQSRSSGRLNWWTPVS